MTTKRGRGAGDVTPPGADDFGRIHGIGAAIKSRLYVADILTFAQLADLSPDEIAARIGDFPGKSAELLQEWIDQARALTLTPQDEPQVDVTVPAEPQPDVINSAIRLRPATFTVELRLNEDNTVHHTRVTHHQSEDKGSWANWEEARLLDFIVTHAELRVPPAEPAVLAAEVVEPAAPIEPAAVLGAPAEPLPAPVEPAEPPEPTPAPVAPPAAARPAPLPAVTTDYACAPHLQALEVVPADEDAPSRVLRHDQPFGVRLTFDLAGVTVPGNTQLDYTAAVYAKSVASRSRQTVGEAHGAISPSDTVVVNLAGKALPPGMYRLEATVALTTPSTTPSRPGPAALIESDVLQVY